MPFLLSTRVSNSTKNQQQRATTQFSNQTNNSNYQPQGNSNNNNANKMTINQEGSQDQVQQNEPKVQARIQGKLITNNLSKLQLLIC